MSKEKHFWAWPIACYLFLGGLGGGITVLAAIADLFFGVGDVFAIAPLVAAVCLGGGSALFVFELGRPFQFWRVFSTQKAIMTFGAWMLLILMAVDVVYFSFFPTWFSWADAEGARLFFAVVAGILGLGVMLYTGILLSSLRARAFWNTPLLPVLFTVSALSTGAAACSLLAGVWPYAGSAEAVESVHSLLHSVDLVLIVFELIVVLLFVIMMYTAANPTARKAAGRWLKGSFSGWFWVGLIIVGLLIPLVIYAVGGSAAATLAPVLALIGGLILRFLVVYSDDRRMFSGEERYWERLPRGDEAFLKAWK